MTRNLFEHVINTIDRQPAMPAHGFQQAFEFCALNARIPRRRWDSLRWELEATVDAPQNGFVIVQNHLPSLEDWDWPDGDHYLWDLIQEPPGAADYAKLFASFVRRRYRIQERWKRIEQSTLLHPYLMLSKGSSPAPCPQHADLYDIAIKSNDIIWQTHPVAESVFCNCSLRPITEREKLQLDAQEAMRSRQEEQAELV